jgi:hypothetical protein
LAAGFFATAFLAAGAAAFLAAGFFAAAFLAAGAAFLAAGFLSTAFLAAGFFSAAFLAAGFFAAALAFFAAPISTSLVVNVNEKNTATRQLLHLQHTK